VENRRRACLKNLLESGIPFPKAGRSKTSEHSKDTLKNLSDYDNTLAETLHNKQGPVQPSRELRLSCLNALLHTVKWRHT
jgi:hypothetical protein